mgnify:CR=1 FL=1
MKFVRLTAAILAAAAVPAIAVAKHHVPTVGGAAMYPSKTIVENAATAPNLTTLVAAVKAAGLVDTLSGPGPFALNGDVNRDNGGGMALAAMMARGGGARTRTGAVRGAPT